MAPNLLKDETMQLEYAKDPRWASAEHTMIDLTIKWDGINQEYPFTASPTDVEAHGRAIFEAASQGAFGPVAEYVTPPQPEQPETPQE
jgi:hypothetical protein